MEFLSTTIYSYDGEVYDVLSREEEDQPIGSQDETIPMLMSKVNGIESFRFAPEKGIFAGKNDGKIIYWKCQTKSLLNVTGRILNGHTGPVLCMDFHCHLGKDGLLFSGGADRTIKVWDLRSDNRGENVVQTISAHGGSVTCVRLFSGSALISSSSDGTVKTWFPVEGRGRLLYPWYALGQSISLGGSWATSFCIRDGLTSTLYIGDSSGCLFLYTANITTSAIASSSMQESSNGNPNRIFTLKRKHPGFHSHTISHLSIVNDNNFVVSLSFDNKAQVLEAITGTTSATIENFNRARFTSCAWDSKEGLLVLGDAIGYLHIYDILTDKCIKKEKLFCNGAPMIGLGFSLSLDYMHMVACMANCAIRYVVNRDFKHIELLEHTQTILGIAMDESNEIIDSEPTLTVPSKNRFFTVGQDNFIHCWDSYDMKLIYSFEEKESKMSCAVHAELSRKLITGHENGSIKAWSFDTGNFIRAKDSDEAILCLTCGIISDQEFILTGCVGGTVTTWGLTTDSITLIFVMEVASKEKKEDIVSIVFSSGNFLNQKGAELFVLGLNSGRVLLYNFGKRCLLTELSGHQDSITGLVYDGCILFSSSEDGTLRMWNLIDPTNAYELCKLQTNATKAICTVTSLAVMHDCGFLVCGYNDGSLIVWDYKSFEDESDFKNYGRIVYNTKPDTYIKCVSYWKARRSIICGTDQGKVIVCKLPTHV